MIELDSRDMGQLADPHSGYYGKKKRSAWAAFVDWDKPLLVLILVSVWSAFIALSVLFSPALNIVLDFMGLSYPGWIEWKNWIMVGDRGLVIGAAFGFIALLFALLARFRVRRNWSVYAEAGCPRCHEHELIRVRRKRRDRVLSFFGMPVRRYSCRNCTWHGARLVGYRYEKKVDKIEIFEVDNIEVDDGMSVNQIELIDEPIDTATTLIAPVIAADINMVDLGREEAPVARLQGLVERPIELAEVAVIANAMHEEELASEEIDGESVEPLELEGEPASGKAEVVNMQIVYDAEIDEVQSEVAEEIADIEDRSETDIEDDDFDRLCFEVALAKK